MVDDAEGLTDPGSDGAVTDRENLRSRLAAAAWPPFWLLSPTWALASVLKTSNRTQRATVMRVLNGVYFYLSIAVTVAVASWARDDAAAIRPIGFSWGALCLQLLLLSRFWEVGFAFLRDAQDKLCHGTASSSLQWGERVKLALRSYVELILVFGLVFALLPRAAWVNSGSTTPPDRITDMVWYSANVITTSGGGGFLPDSPWAKLLSIAEVLCGVILLVVSFTVYVSRALGGNPTTLDRD